MRGSHIIKETPPSTSHTTRQGSWIDKALKEVKKTPDEWFRIMTYTNKSSASSTSSAIGRGKHGHGFETAYGETDKPGEFGVWVKFNQEAASAVPQIRKGA